MTLETIKNKIAAGFLTQVDLALRIAVLCLSIVMGVITLIACAQIANAATLRQTSVIEGESMTLGDVFEGLDAEKSAYVLGPAPQPGRDMVLDAATLQRIASALNLPWKPQSPAEQLLIHRAATIINSSDIESLLDQALRANGLAGNFVIGFNGTAPEIVLPQTEPATADIISIRHDPQKDTFEAFLAAPSKSEPLVRLNISGTVQRMASIPVLTNTVQNGAVITADNVEWIDIPTRGIQRDTVMDAEQLIGMTPRRIATAGKPLRLGDVMQPRAVKRSGQVTIIYNENNLFLTAKGRALDDGAKGDFIRVVNIGSNRTIEARITGEHEVTVSDGSTAANEQTITQ